MDTAATWIQVVGIAVFVLACGVVAVLWRGSVNVYPLRPAEPVRARLEAVPEPVELEPARVPSPWAVDMLRDLMWIDRQLGERVSRELIRVVAGYQGRESQEVIREITAARHVVKGELAS